MSNRFAIPDTLVPQLLQLYREGKKGDELVIWLRETHNLDVHRNSVYRRIKEMKEIENAAIRQSVKEAAQQEALNCVDIINTTINKFHTASMELLQSEKPSDKAVAKQLSDTTLKFIEKKLSLGGTDNDVSIDAAETKALLNELLGKLGN